MELKDSYRRNLDAANAFLRSIDDCLKQGLQKAADAVAEIYRAFDEEARRLESAFTSLGAFNGRVSVERHWLINKDLSDRSAIPDRYDANEAVSTEVQAALGLLERIEEFGDLKIGLIEVRCRFSERDLDFKIAQRLGRDFPCNIGNLGVTKMLRGYEADPNLSAPHPNNLAAYYEVPVVACYPAYSVAGIVNRAVGGFPLISEEQEPAVLRALDELGYKRATDDELKQLLRREEAERRLLDEGERGRRRLRIKLSQTG